MRQPSRTAVMWYSAPFVLVTKKDTALSESAQKFFDYVTSEAANEIISGAGVVPAN